MTARSWEAVGDLLLRHYAEVLAEHRGEPLPATVPVPRGTPEPAPAPAPVPSPVPAPAPVPAHAEEQPA